MDSELEILPSPYIRWDGHAVRAAAGDVHGQRGTRSGIGRHLDAHELRTAGNDEQLTAHLARFSLLWRASLIAKGSGERARDEWAAESELSVLSPALPGVGMMLALDALQHPSALVRTAAQRWLVDASGAPHALMRPLIALLLSRGSNQQLQLYALAKLRAALASMPAGTLHLLAQTPAPRLLTEECGAALDSSLRRRMAPDSCCVVANALLVRVFPFDRKRPQIVLEDRVETRPVDTEMPLQVV